MTISLKDILEIKPGTLIKGLKINFSGSVSLSIEGWKFDQKRFVKNLWSTVDREQFVFTYYIDTKVQEQIKNNKIIKFDAKNLNIFSLRENGNSFFKDVQTWFMQTTINSGDCLGMSLGESFIAIQPSHHEIYRPDFYQIFLFHKVLYEQKVIWIALHSKKINKRLILIESNPELFNISLELI